MKMNKRLIVNADDLGRTPGINAGVFEAHEEGILTSATLMVGFEAAAEAAAQLARHPGLGIGLHVTLTGSRPLLPPERVPSLVDVDGRLPSRPDELVGAAPDEVRAEAEAQYERFLELVGHPPTHLDSHHHSHRLPVVLDAVVGLAQRHSLPVRAASEEVARKLAELRIATTDHFVEDFFGEAATLDNLLRIVDQLPPGATELMCHPARVDAELRRDSSYVDERETELAVLTHPKARAAIQSAGIELITFGAL